VLHISKSAWYDWKKQLNAPNPEQGIRARVRAIFVRSKGTYGRIRIVAELRNQGEIVNHKRVYRLMKEEGLVVATPRSWKRTTVSDPALPVAENLLNRQFSPATPNQVWASDITYIPTAEGWLFLAVILDLYSRKVVGWAVADHMRTELCLEALEQALVRRQPGAGWMHHSDRGSQYASAAYRKRLHRAEACVSMSRKGNCWDNAAVESFFGTLKADRIDRQLWATRREASQALLEYIPTFYNQERLHSHNGYHSPDDAELAYRSTRHAMAA
jgi:transposase InsO family protein